MDRAEEHTTDRGFLPLRAAAHALGWFVNPRGNPGEDKLRESVSGKVVLVTGASYGIGEATTRLLGSAGATVLLVARSEDRLRELCREIERDGGAAYAYPTDMSDLDAVERLVERVLERHGHVDVIVNNAGKSIRRSIERSYQRFHDFERTISVNYLGPVKLLLGLLPSMRARRQGHLVNVSTLGVRVPPAPRWSAYVASKAAFDVFFRTVAVEVAADGLTATSIYMGLVRTRMSAPTPSLRYVPGLSPEQAAGLVCKAIVDKPGVISSWWVGAAEAGFALTRRPWEVATGVWSRQSEDTEAAVFGTSRAQPGAGEKSGSRGASGGDAR